MDYIIDRQVFEAIWFSSFSFYDLLTDEEKIKYENDIFECRAYHWDDEINDYHFYHKPSGYKLAWYKYPLRGAEANMDLTPRQFLEILVDCKNSYYEDKIIRFKDCTVGKWWEK